MRIAMLGLKGIPYQGGIENVVEEIGSRLAQRGHQVTVYVRPYVEVNNEYKGMKIRRLFSINTKHLDAFSHTFLAGLDSMAKNFDIVHYHALGPSTLSFIPRIKGIKTIAHIHGLDWQRKKWDRFSRTFLKFGEFAAVHFPDKTLVVSRVLEKYLENKYKRKIEYIPNGVNMPPGRNPEEILKMGLEKNKYILFIGRLVPEKGIHYLIEAFRGLDTDKKLVIAGGSSHSDDYTNSLQTMAKGSNIIFTGYVKGKLLEELFSNAYLYVIPSEIEGLSVSLLQALSYGRCVLASDIPENKEALGSCGYTFKSKDVDNLRERLVFLLNNGDLVKKEYEKGKKRVREEYSWERVVDRLEGIYKQLVPE